MREKSPEIKKWEQEITALGRDVGMRILAGHPDDTIGIASKHKLVEIELMPATQDFGSDDTEDFVSAQSVLLPNSFSLPSSLSPLRSEGASE